MTTENPTLIPETTPPLTTGAPRLRPRGSGRLAALEPTLLPLASFAILIALWEIASRAGLISAFFFSSPTGVMEAAAENIVLPEFWNDVWISTQEFMVGYIAAIALAIPFGLLTGWFRSLHFLFEPWLAAFNSTPRLALLPLVVLWVGLGFWSKAVIVFLGVFFPVVVNCMAGVRGIPTVYVDVAKNYGASTLQYLRFVAMPGALPLILSGLRIGLAQGIILVAVAELVGAREGLGYMIQHAWELQSVRTMYVALFTIGAIGIVSSLVLRELEQKLVAWKSRDE